MALDGHVPDELLERYSLGVVPEAEAADLEEHLLLCECCQDRLRETDVFIEAMRGAVREAVSPRAGWMAWRWAAVAAALVLGVWMSARPQAGPAPVAVVLEATRGGGPTAPARQPLDLVLDRAGLPGLPSYRVEIVDSESRPVLRREVRPQGERLRVEAPPLPVGSYWIRLSRDAELYREFGLRVR
jgi:hypothetical protein